MIDLDRYYTPISLAENAIRKSVHHSPSWCVDTTCGAGNLLYAAQNVFPTTKCIGSDRDTAAIKKLRKDNPHWVLSQADLLKDTSYKKSKVSSYVNKCDLILLNPPFSHGHNKYTLTTYNRIPVRASVAMSHILKTIELFAPDLGAVMIVPESLLYSETDATARQLLNQKYSIDVISELACSTFSGTRANTAIIKLEPKSRSKYDEISTLSRIISKSDLAVSIVRGGLPMHSFIESLSGATFIHSTDLVKIGSDRSYITKLNKTNQIKAGHISDQYSLLIPRVGLPSTHGLPIIQPSLEIQLSDCVIALKAGDKDSLIELRKKIITYWASFTGLYRGTGARYITLARLVDWMHNIGVKVSR